MRQAVAEADRSAVVRSAARDWLSAGLIDRRAAAALERAFPDDRRRLGPVLRSLAFVFTILACGAAYAFLLLMMRSPSQVEVAGPFALLLGLLLLFVTEHLRGPLRLADAGVESASGLTACGLILIAAAWIVDEAHWGGYDLLTKTVLLTGAILFGGTAIRWGSTVGAALATILLGCYLMQFSGARITWIVAALVIVPFALFGSESRKLAPSHRRACAVALLGSLMGLYIALHLGSFDARFLERTHRFGQAIAEGRTGVPRELFILTTAIVPIAILAYGIATRRRLLFDFGALLGAASLVTLRFYVHLAPLWTILTAAGAALILLALSLRRWLSGGVLGERRGYTAQPLSGAENKAERVLATVATAAVATPRGSEAAPTETRFEGKGGRSGGGGATSDY